MKKILSVLLVAMASQLVWAQGAPGSVLGSVSALDGLVTISRGDRLVSAAVGSDFSQGNRIVTTAGASATLSFKDGCQITLKANQSLIIDKDLDCKALLASVSTLGDPAVAVAGAGSGGGPLVIGGTIGLGLILINQNNSKLSGS
ncbi:MAG: hypothetical protein IAE92_06465 [Burkholderiaceae bacterium]|nr:hypothetical protein [Burkholderiaceae bacterium]